MSAFPQSPAFDTAQASEVAAEHITIVDSEAATELCRSDFIDQLIGSYRQLERAIMETAQFIKTACAHGVMNYFAEGMRLQYGHEVRFAIPTDTDAALAALRVEFWHRLLVQTQIFEAMPVNKRVEARKQFSGLDCPPFDESTVRPTIENLLLQRSSFFAERVDTIFRGLSKTHITNRPEGFSKKLIIAGVFDKFGYTNSYKAGLISDLRGVVGRLTRRGEPSEYDTRRLLGRLYETKIGTKVRIDGGAFTLTVYGVGTVHFEVAAEVAAELNSILAARYPHAIPSKFRTAPKRPGPLSFDLAMDRLSMEVISILQSMRFSTPMRGASNVFSRITQDVAKAVEVLESIGGSVRLGASKTDLFAEFDFDPQGVIEQIVFSGEVPEQASFQFYATKGEIGKEAASRLAAEPGMLCCEPSAGTGDLAALLPKETTLCIEIARVRAKVLDAKGYNTVNADFLSWAEQNPQAQFDRILMNPPFSKGRAKAHLCAASRLLKEDGRLVAILPASMLNTAPLEGIRHDWSEVYSDQFEGTAVSVVILTASKV